MASTLLLLTLPLLTSVDQDPVGPGAARGEMAGEVRQHEVVLQSRLTQGPRRADGSWPGAPGVARFRIWPEGAPDSYALTPWIRAEEERDFVLKQHVVGLEAGAQYVYQLESGADREQLRLGPERRFRTLPAADQAAPVSFVVVTGMNYNKFHTRAANRQDPEAALGYPAQAAMRALDPDWFVGTGDNVYYDHPREPAAVDRPTMRAKWSQQFAQPRSADLFGSVASFWEVDDHDHRFNDSDRGGDRPPSAELGDEIFFEQLPLGPWRDAGSPRYRSFRAGALLQVWLLDVRHHRDRNRAEDGPEKSLWGAEQRAWLKATLAASDAPVKILISPTPMVGPDDAYKKDNHTNHGGFRHEGDAWFAWLQDEGFDPSAVFLVCGDRHWQYHSVHPSGFEEFSCGALVDANARIGRAPGDPKSTDPDAEIRQPWTQAEASGGFLHVQVHPTDEGALTVFTFRDERGEELHRVERPVRTAADQPSPGSSEDGSSGGGS